MENQLKTFILENKNGMHVEFTNYGGKIMSILVPDKDDRMADVVLGYDTPQEYLQGEQYFGASIGRFANRIANGRFTLDGTEYLLPVNNGPNCLHGGPNSFVAKIWEIIPKGNTLQCSYVSPDMEEGFPGKLTFHVTYTLTDDNSLIVDYKAVSDKKTVVNFTQHSYFNLKGEGKGNVHDHLLKINASKITPLNDVQIPTGEIRSVEGTPFDFREFKAIGVDIDKKDEQLAIGRGYDLNFTLDGADGGLHLAAVLREPESHRQMEVFTTEPGLQLYTGNWLGSPSDKPGKGGKRYVERAAVCLETQHYPDSPNQPSFPSTELKSGKEFNSRTVFRFSVY